MILVDREWLGWGSQSRSVIKKFFTWIKVKDNHGWTRSVVLWKEVEKLYVLKEEFMKFTDKVLEKGEK